MDKKANKIFKFLLCVALSAVFLFPLANFSYGEVLAKQMVFGKEYRIEDIPGEQGKCMVYWGDESVKWEPDVETQDEELVEKGPILYLRWIPEVGKLDFQPWCMPLAEREKLDGAHAYERWIHNETSAMCVDTAYTFGAAIKDPKDRLRIRLGLEWKKNFVFNDPESGVRYKAIFGLTYPDDIKGISTFSINYTDPRKPDESWLYLPSVRRVRRMSAGNKQDAVFGTTIRYEDLTQMNPFYHDYKIVRTELYKGQDSNKWGWGNSKCELSVKELDGIGEPCWVIEGTPYRKDWFWTKKLMWIGIFTNGFHWEEDYDKNGDLIRTVEYSNRNLSYIQKGFLSWGNWSGTESKTGYSSVWWSDWGDEHSGADAFNVGYSNNVFSPKTLVKEPSSLKDIKTGGGKSFQIWRGKKLETGR